MEKHMFLTIVTPNEASPRIECDDFLFRIPADTQGHGEGAYGIHPGFQNTLLALNECTIVALLDKQECFRANVGAGTINVEKDEIIVLTEFFEIIHG